MEGSRKTYGDEAAPDVERWGGKLGGLEFLRERGPNWLQEAIPETIFVEPGQMWDGKTPEVDTREDAYIIRGSHKNDFDGLVDAIPTYSDMSAVKIAESIEELRLETSKEIFLNYARYEDPNFDEKITVGIQPFYPYRAGSIVEHPNQPGVFLISKMFIMS